MSGLDTTSASTDSAAVVAAIVAVVASVVVAEKGVECLGPRYRGLPTRVPLVWTRLRSRRAVLVIAYLACVGVIGARIVGMAFGWRAPVLVNYLVASAR